MLETVLNNAGDPETRQTLSQTRQQNKTLTTEQTVARLVKLLAEQKYKSGDHIDYFDEI